MIIFSTMRWKRSQSNRRVIARAVEPYTSRRAAMWALLRYVKATLRMLSRHFRFFGLLDLDLGLAARDLSLTP
jgi:hypothetical protein